ncbi:MAG: PEGA domain-containing protein [bacterium]
MILNLLRNIFIIRFYYLLFLHTLILFMASSNGLGLKNHKILIGCISNNTEQHDLNNLSGAMAQSNNIQTWFDELELAVDTLGIVFDDRICPDSFPDETQILKAREYNADQLIWGRVDSTEQGLKLSIIILNLANGRTGNINIALMKNPARSTVLQTIEQKLWSFFQRQYMAQLIISTAPSMAKIFIDSMESGITPFETLIDPGTYNLNMEKEGYIPSRQTLTFLAGNTYQYSIPLMEKNPGRRYRIPKKCASGTLISAAVSGLLHWRYAKARNAYMDYMGNTAEIPGLYNRAVAWEILRDISLGGTAVLFGITFKKSFFQGNHD